MKARTTRWVMLVVITYLALCAYFILPAEAGLSQTGRHGRLGVTSKSDSDKQQSRDNDDDDDNGDDDRSSSTARSCVFINANAVDNDVIALVRDPNTGRLSRRGRFDTDGVGDPNVGAFQQHSVVSDGTYLYAVNPGDNTITAFEIQSGCSLRRLNTVNSEGLSPESLALSRGLLYVANAGGPPSPPAEEVPPAGNYSGFRIRGDGSIRPGPIATFPLNPGDSPSDILFNEKGERLIGLRLRGNIIDSFNVNEDGTISPADSFGIAGNNNTFKEINPNLGVAPFSAIFDPNKERRFYVAFELFPGVASYALSKGGLVHELDRFFCKPYPNCMDPCWLAISKNGMTLYAANFIPGSIDVYSISGDGALQRLGTHSFGHGVPLGGTDIALDSQGRFLYHLRVFDPDGVVLVQPRVDVLRVRGNPRDNGGLQHVETEILPGVDLKEAGVMGLVIVDR